MKLVGCILLLAMVLTGSVSNGATTQTQGELNQTACEKYKRADAEMNKTYQQIFRAYAKDQLFLDKLKAAQRAWLAFRDAHLESLYPDPSKGAYGSVNPMCRCIALENLTLERTKALQQWIQGLPEGDVCAGSIRVKP